MAPDYLPKPVRRIAALGMLTISSLAAAPDLFVGAHACAACHPAEFASQRMSAHAAALSRVADNPDLPTGRLRRDPRYRFEILHGEEGLRVRIDDGAGLMELPLEWAFGAGRQAITFVTRVNRDWYLEHFASWYAAAKAYGATPGQDQLRPKDMREAAGLLYKISDPQFGIQGCFECHSTGPVSFDAEGRAGVTEMGVRCESCHGPGSAHVVNPEHARLSESRKLVRGGLKQLLRPLPSPAGRTSRHRLELRLERSPPAGIPEPEPVLSEKRRPALLPDLSQSSRARRLETGGVFQCEVRAMPRKLRDQRARQLHRLPHAPGLSAAAAEVHQSLDRHLQRGSETQTGPVISTADTWPALFERRLIAASVRLRFHRRSCPAAAFPRPRRCRGEALSTDPV